MKGSSAAVASTWTRTVLGDLGDLYCGQSPSSADVNRDGTGVPYVTGPEQWDGTTLHLDYVTVYILIVGIGFALLLSGLTDVDFTAVPWNNTVLHYVMPVVMLIDLLIDRPAKRIRFGTALRSDSGSRPVVTPPPLL